jgi:hypothetical protein
MPELVLAPFDHQWPVLNFAVAHFEKSGIT